MTETMIDYSGPIYSFADAKKSGSKRYFTDKPCKYGHVAQRLVSCRVCCSCACIRVSGLQKARSPVYLRRVAKEIKNRTLKNEKRAGRKRSSSCELCGVKATTVFDHCHAGGHFRGWLCSQCNMALGLVKDNSSLLRKMARYLDRSNGMAKQRKSEGLSDFGLLTAVAEIDMGIIK